MESIKQGQTVDTDWAEEYRNLISFLRSRLDIISTSAFLLEESLADGRKEAIKYIQKINDEMESIRKYINM